MDFSMKKPKLGKMVKPEEFEELVEHSTKKCNHKHGSVKAGAIYSKMLDGKIKEL